MCRHKESCDGTLAPGSNSFLKLNHFLPTVPTIYLSTLPVLAQVGTFDMSSNVLLYEIHCH